MARRAELALAALVVGALAAACNSGFRDASRRLAAPAESTAAERRDVRRTYWDRAATRPKSEVGWLLRRDGTSVKDGVERSWYASGQLEYERHWRRDQPFGLWRTWFEDGTQRFEHDYVPGEATPMTWWLWVRRRSLLAQMQKMCRKASLNVRGRTTRTVLTVSSGPDDWRSTRVIWRLRPNC